MGDNIFLFIPNIIDYFRVITALLSFYYMRTDYMLTTFWYLLSGLLDAIDGHAARMLDQGSKLGALLDMLIDRCATMCLLAALCHFYPDYMMFFQISMSIDITSHWFHVQSSLMKGATSHKTIDLGANPVLRHYYHNRKILFVMCAANELFYCMLYLTYFTSGPFNLFSIILYLSAPLALIKTGISILQLVVACQNVAAVDVADRAAVAGNKKQ
ncbi:CDIPT [Mytilus coruscus]|uniref:CDP-diacylglycerol--inositol 3-phosphatidyltransferase n=1 Tax=Mytilus coruscus TaxID=42192 RepID=A0A6J8B7K4_MYTCO|nr:CDIPT [Mytilus coruscus]